MVQSTTMKVAADRNAEVTPATKSTGESVAMRKILGDAVFRILVVAADEVELIVAAVGQPARQHALVSQARQRRWIPIRANTCATPSRTLPIASGKNTAVR